MVKHGKYDWPVENGEYCLVFVFLSLLSSKCEPCVYQLGCHTVVQHAVELLREEFYNERDPLNWFGLCGIEEIISQNPYRHKASHQSVLSVAIVCHKKTQPTNSFVSSCNRSNGISFIDTKNHGLFYFAHFSKELLSFQMQMKYTE